ncbi:hypothetical protein C6N75_09985 [Streptomyces solincola]|uniref:Uncharacterized protein n=1 Tax=Streptomyces solincola TaxID=2100817 RepID=A0A2S9PYG3_9ACTN|nr:hypothetical protein [Streptomyces solincola]PRH79403.1 hypothetical protein C6N75_09985 [Streptomyces solincola]
MAALSTHNIVNAGTKPTFVAAAASDTAEIGSGHNTFVVYRNTDSNAKTVTVTVPGQTEYGQAYTYAGLTLAATTGELWIPMRKAFDPADGSSRATLNVAGTGGVTGVTVAVVRMS